MNKRVAKGDLKIILIDKNTHDLRIYGKHMSMMWKANANLIFSESNILATRNECEK